MQTLILVIHILACVIMTGLVLIQKSEGGGLGIGGGGGGNSLLSGRGAAGALVRSTIIFGGIFFATSMTLTTLAGRNVDTRTEVERVLGGDEEPASTGPADLTDPTAPMAGQQGLSDLDVGDGTEPSDDTESDISAPNPQ